VNIEDKAFVTGMRPDTGHDTKPDIRIDKEGVWYYRGTVMFRKDIVQSLYQHLKRDPDGRYHIEIGEDRADVDVEDTPYVVKSVSCIFMDGKGKDVINLHMPDDLIPQRCASAPIIPFMELWPGWVLRPAFPGPAIIS
jgi:hypothetical protein